MGLIDMVGGLLARQPTSDNLIMEALLRMISDFVDQMSPGSTLLTGVDAGSMKVLDVAPIVGR